MRKLTAAMFVAALVATAGLGFAQPPGGEKGGEKGGRPGGEKGGERGKGGPGGPGGPGGFGGFGGFARGGMGGPGQILPPFLQDQLKLTDAQKKEVETLQKDLQAKLDQILTADQKKQLAEIRERGPGGFGGGRPGGEGGRPGGRPGGEGGRPGGNPPPKQKD